MEIEKSLESSQFCRKNKLFKRQMWFSEGISNQHFLKFQNIASKSDKVRLSHASDPGAGPHSWLRSKIDHSEFLTNSEFTFFHKFTQKTRNARM